MEQTTVNFDLVKKLDALKRENISLRKKVEEYRLDYLAEWTKNSDCKTKINRMKKVNANLLETLKEVVRTLESDTHSIIDTIWVSNGCPETLYDHCCAAIAEAEGDV